MGRQVAMFLSKFWLVPLALLVISACTNCEETRYYDGTPRVEIEDVTIQVEVPHTPDLRTKGLTGRPYLQAGKGMLYIPDGPDAGVFWMKGMRFPLDFIWIGSNCRVVDVNTYVSVPYPDTPDDRIPTYRSYPRAAYTLEVNAGDADRYDIRVGDKVRFENIYGHCRR